MSLSVIKSANCANTVRTPYEHHILGTVSTAYEHHSRAVCSNAPRPQACEQCVNVRTRTLMRAWQARVPLREQPEHARRARRKQEDVLLARTGHALMLPVERRTQCTVRARRKLQTLRRARRACSGCSRSGTRAFQARYRARLVLRRPRSSSHIYTRPEQAMWALTVATAGLAEAVQ